MENTLMYKREKKLSRLYAFVALLLVCFYLVTELVFDFWYRVAANYGLFLIITFIALSFFLRFFNSSKEEKCVVVYAVWVLISRILNGDVFLDREFYFLVRTVLNTGSFMCVGFVLDTEDRKRFFNIVCAIACGYWFVLASVGLYATMNFTRIALPPADMTVGVGKLLGNKQLLVDNIHRNVSAVWFALATLMMIYQFFSCRRKIWRVPIVLAGIVFYFATAMSFCRSIQVGLCAAITMLAVLLVLQLFSHKTKRIRTLLVIAAVIVVLPLSYAGYSAATHICSELSICLTGGEDAPTEQKAETTMQDLSYSALPLRETEESPDTKESDEKNVFSEARGKESYMEFGGRIPLWKAGMIVLREEPQRLLKGGMIGPYMERIVELNDELTNRYNRPNSQMHNFIIDSLLLTGLPGALILVVFTVFVVLRMIKVFFAMGEQVPFQLKLLTLPLAMLFIDNMMEAHIFRYDIMPSILFFLICGIFLAWSYEVLPCKTRKK